MKHENWAVQCPQDYATNEKWKEIVKWLVDTFKWHIKGNNTSRYYGVHNEDSVNFTDGFEKCNRISIDEAHDMLFGTPIKYTIYQELKIQAFKREALDDIVFFDMFGVHPYLMKKKVTKNSKLIWDFCIPELDLIEYWVDGIKVSEMKVEQVKEFLTKINN